MATLKELKSKINSVKNTQKTTRAMKLVSTAKLKRAEEALLMSREYARKIDEVIKENSAKLASIKDSINLRAFAHIENPQKVDLIVVTADKGLCGGFNIQTIKATLAKIEELKEKMKNTDGEDTIELKESSEDKRVIYAMITNFQKRLEVLQNLMLQLEEFENYKEIAKKEKMA